MNRAMRVGGGQMMPKAQNRGINLLFWIASHENEQVHPEGVPHSYRSGAQKKMKTRPSDSPSPPFPYRKISLPRYAAAG